VADYFGGAWRGDGTIFFVGRIPNGLMRVAAGGGKAEPAVASVLVNGSEQLRPFAWPQLLPGGERVLVIDWGTEGEYGPALLDLKTRELRPLDLAAGFCRYAAPGHLVCMRQDTSLVAVPFDVERGVLRGAPVALMNDLSVSGNLGAVLAFSDTGTLAYTTGHLRNSLKELFQLVRLRTDGSSEPLPIAPAEFSRTIRLSPDRTRLAVTTWDGSVWIYDLRRGTRVKVAQQRSADHPAWSPDGRQVAFGYETASGCRIGRVPADGSQPSEDIFFVPNSELILSAYTADGRLLFSSDSGGPFEAWMTAADPKAAPTKVVGAAQPRSFILGATPSPDGRWLAYTSNETGRQEIYVRPFAGGAAVPASVGGGDLPRWSLDGRELYYVNGDRLLAVSVSDGVPLHIGPADELTSVTELRSYDVLGRREFLALQRLPDSGIQTRVHLIVNWFEELRRLAPAPGAR
jgi:serine/threonine-protein kinase